MDSDVPPLEVPPERAARRAPWVGIILGAVLGVGAVVVVVPSGRQLPGILPGAGPLLKAAACLAAVFAAASAPLVHELGHVAGGWLAGYRFVWLVWGPVQVGREGGGLRFSWNRSLALAGGMALSVPSGSRSRSAGPRCFSSAEGRC